MLSGFICIKLWDILTDSRPDIDGSLFKFPLDNGMGKEFFPTKYYGTLLPTDQLYRYVPMESTYPHASSISVDYHIDGLMQICSNSSALAMELL